MNCSIYTGHSKSGKEFMALRVTIGEYETLVFPSRAELAYIKAYLATQAHQDFKGDDLDVDSD